MSLRASAHTGVAIPFDQESGEDNRRDRHRSGDGTARRLEGKPPYFGHKPALRSCFSLLKGKVCRTSVLVYESVLFRKQYCKAGMDSHPTFPLIEGDCHTSLRTGSQ